MSMPVVMLVVAVVKRGQVAVSRVSAAAGGRDRVDFVAVEHSAEEARPATVSGVIVIVAVACLHDQLAVHEVRTVAAAARDVCICGGDRVKQKR